MSEKRSDAWLSFTLRDVIGDSGLIADGDWIESKDQDPNGKIRIVQLADIGDGRFLNRSNRFINEETAKKLKVTYLRDGDLLMARMPDPIGRVCLFYDQLKRCVTVVDVAILRTDRVNPYWLMSVLNSSDIRNEIALKSSGTTRTRIAKREIEEILVQVPPLKEQQKIAEILTSVDEVIENTQSQIDKLEDLKKATMNELLTKGIGHIEFKETAFGRIPKGWDALRINSVIEKFQNGYAFSASGYVASGIPIVSIANISLQGEYQFDKKKEKKWSVSDSEDLSRFWVTDGDLIIAMTDVTPTMNLIGRGAIIERSEKMLLNQRVGLIKTNSRISSKFLCLFFNGEYWRDYAKKSSGLGAQANLGTKEILDGHVVLPTVVEQEQIVRTVSTIANSIRSKQLSVSKLNNIKKSLMQDLLTGKVRVKVD